MAAGAPTSTMTIDASDQLAAMAAQFERQRAIAHSEAPPSKAVRIDRLKRALALLTENRDRIVEAVSADFGYRSADQTWFVEVITTAKPLKEAIKRVGGWMRPERRRLDAMFQMAGAQAHIHYQPKGVVGCVSPWNFPFNLTFAPLAGILAAGNRAMVKPSEVTPASSALIHELITERFDPDEISVVQGGAEVAAAFTQLPFDHLVYTGGEAVAKTIAASAAKNLTPLTLELGGKSPVIVGERADLDLAARRIIFGKFLNAGQICLAPDYVLAPADCVEPLVEALQRAVLEMAPTDRGARDFVSIVNERHAERLRAYVDDAERSGARLVRFDHLSKADSPNMVPLTLFIAPGADTDIMREEVFGPLLAIVPYRGTDAAIAAVNARPRPLALYYFGKGGSELAKILAETRSGGVTVNDVIMHYTMDDLPFGGVGPSGYGAYHGRSGFLEFSHARSVYRQSPFDIGKLLRPPYGEAFKRMGAFLLRHG